jgi:hypothetical protein
VLVVAGVGLTALRRARSRSDGGPLA